MNDAVLAGYEAAAADLIPRFERISPAALYAPVADLLPAAPARIADIGAGTGRDAAWLAQQGHHVTAVEPVAAFREAGRTLHSSSSITWLDDRLPALHRLAAQNAVFDRVLLSAIWQHLDDEQRGAALHRFARLIALDGMILLSLRQGPGAAARPAWPVSVARTRTQAQSAGLEVTHERNVPSVQATNFAAGVRWTWLALVRRSIHSQTVLMQNQSTA